LIRLVVAWLIATPLAEEDDGVEVSTGESRLVRPVEPVFDIVVFPVKLEQPVHIVVNPDLFVDGLLVGTVDANPSLDEVVRVHILTRRDIRFPGAEPCSVASSCFSSAVFSRYFCSRRSNRPVDMSLYCCIAEQPISLVCHSISVGL
jgi:hypothetical protein